MPIKPEQNDRIAFAAKSLLPTLSSLMEEARSNVQRASVLAENPDVADAFDLFNKIREAYRAIHDISPPKEK